MVIADAARTQHCPVKVAMPTRKSSTTGRAWKIARERNCAAPAHQRDTETERLLSLACGMDSSTGRSCREGNSARQEMAIWSISKAAIRTFVNTPSSNHDRPFRQSRAQRGDSGQGKGDTRDGKVDGFGHARHKACINEESRVRDARGRSQAVAE